MGELGAAKSDGRNSPDLASLSEECLSAAEDAAQKVLNCVRPTLDSEEKRRDVVDYVQRLIKTHLNCEVFPYGSVPLKTYLPDGDIDFTAFEGLNGEKSLALDVLAVLQKEEHNEFAEFQIKDTHFIDAEVKLVKCLVRDIVIDISFNQLGGLATLCFLEQVDRLVGKNHLFKRSIILVKTWCYYESRILGAHHGLISTYALESLVLYIFHLFHSSFNGPLTVLYKFLDYFGQFDWDNYCISLKGPVCKSSLPEVVVKIPESGWDNLMFSEEFLENSVDMFSFASRAADGKPKTFQAKHLNIIDPLRENNNLGRSVNTGNFYRIRSAFKYGARKLGQILVQPKDKIADELNKFFRNTVARHGNDKMGNIHPITFEFGNDESFSLSLSSPVEFCSEDDCLLKSTGSDIDLDNIALESKNWANKMYLEQLPEGYSSVMNCAPDYEPESNCGPFFPWDHNHKLYSFPSKVSAEIGNSEIGYCFQSDFIDLGSCKLKLGSLSLDTGGNYAEAIEKYQLFSLGSSVTKDNVSDSSSIDFREVDWKSIGGESEAFNPLSDLGGDYDSHVRSLLYGQLCHGLSLLATAHHPSSFPLGSQWLPYQQRQFLETGSYPPSVKKSNYQAVDSASPLQKAHAIGTFFPQMNGFTREKQSQWRNRNKAQGRGNWNMVHRYPPTNAESYTALGEQNHFQAGSRAVPNTKNKSKGWGKFDAYLQSPRSDSNGSDTGESCKIEFGSIGSLAEEVISACGDDDAHSPIKQGRAAASPICLKNEAEFPPLCQ